MSQIVRRLLLVDDREDEVFLTKRALKQAGIACGVLWLSGGQEAIDFISGRMAGTRSMAELMPDLIFLDVKMPAVSGFDVLNWLQKHPGALPESVPVVMFSSSGETRDEKRARELGAHAYVVKPADAAVFERLASNLDFTWASLGQTRTISAANSSST